MHIRQNLITVYTVKKEKKIPVLTIYAPVIYTAPYITWGSGRGLGPGIPKFFGPCEMGTSR